LLVLDLASAAAGAAAAFVAVGFFVFLLVFFGMVGGDVDNNNMMYEVLRVLYSKTGRCAVMRLAVRVVLI